MKNILVAIGVIAIISFIILLFVGLKVVSTVVVYIVGILAAISLIGLIIYYIGKMSGSKKD